MTGYTIYLNGHEYLTIGKATSITIPNLTNGLPYQVTVRANGKGDWPFNNSRETEPITVTPEDITEPVKVPPMPPAGITTEVVPGIGLSDVACPSATTCEAVGDNSFEQSMVVTITNGVPGPPVAVPGTRPIEFYGVACPSATTCEAVGGAFDNEAGENVVVPITNGVPGTPVPVPGDFSFLGVACPSATTCEAVGAGGEGEVVVPITGGVPGTPVSPVGSDNGLSSVACTSAATCVATGEDFECGGITTCEDAEVVPITDGVPGTPVVVVPEVVESGSSSWFEEWGFVGVACPSATTCEAVGRGGGGAGNPVPPADSGAAVLPITDGVPGTPAVVVPGPAYFSSVACPSAATCEAVGGGPSGEGMVMPITDGVPGSPVEVPGTTDLSSVACQTATTCEAVGGNASGGSVVVLITTT